MPYFRTRGGCSLYYETVGFDSAAPTIVLLNGTTQTTANWAAHVKVLRGRFRVITYDARAQGKSDCGADSLTVDGHAEDLLALLDRLEVRKCHLAGLSHGACVALALASGAPDRTDRLVLCGIGATASPRARAVVRSWLEILEIAGLEAMAWAVFPIVFGNNYLKEKERNLTAMVRAVVRRNRREALLEHLKSMLQHPPPLQFAEGVRCPTLVFHASDDPLVPRDSALELVQGCRGKFREMAGIGHSIPMENPARFVDETLLFLNNG